MIRFASLRKTLGIAILACAIAPSATLVAQVASPHIALAGIDPYPVPVDGPWHALAQVPISNVVVTRQTEVSKIGTTYTRFVVEAFHGTMSAGTGSTAWAVLDPYHQGSLSVTIRRSCTSIICPPLSTDLQMTTHPAGGLSPTPSMALNVVDHTLTGDVTFQESLFQG